MEPVGDEGRVRNRKKTAALMVQRITGGDAKAFVDGEKIDMERLTAENGEEYLWSNLDTLYYREHDEQMSAAFLRLDMLTRKESNATKPNGANEFEYHIQHFENEFIKFVE